MDTRAVTLALLAARAPGSTICPSEVARALVPPASKGAASPWRDAMPAVHAALDQLLAERAVALSWKGETRPTRSGPYRIGRGEGWPESEPAVPKNRSRKE